MNRSAGILLPISSLPGKYGIGSFSREAYDFIDFLRKAGQTYWQIIPLNPPNHLQAYDNPYLSFSAFAGNPNYISLEELVQKGLLLAEEVESVAFGLDPACINYDLLYENRLPLLRKAYDRADKVHDDAFQSFMNENAWWLDDYALFISLKQFFGGEDWRTWPQDIRCRYGFALDYYREKLYYDIEFHKYLQYLFFEEWFRLKAYANSNHIRMVGDIAIYVSMDSADVWAHPELFQLNEDFEQIAVSGSPPDQFCLDGQVWGSPLYRWEEHRKNDFGWWMSRLWHNARQYDLVRIDHFRGLDEYFSIPFGSSTARNGHWEPGPGMDFFRRMWQNMGHIPLIVEDLGTQTDTVRRLVRDSGYPNMKVLQFAFDPKDYGAANEYLPHNIPEHCIVYTGTHDNPPIKGWYASLSPEEKAMVRDYYGQANDEEIPSTLVKSALMSRGETCVILLQDYLGFGNEARLNTPGQAQGNYLWRVQSCDLTEKVAADIFELTRRYGRMNWDTIS